MGWDREGAWRKPLAEKKVLIQLSFRSLKQPTVSPDREVCLCAFLQDSISSIWYKGTNLDSVAVGKALFFLIYTYIICSVLDWAY